jgi:hypothetical protein
MRYILITKNQDDNTEMSRKEFSSLLQLSKELKTTYCSCYNNFLFHENPNSKPAKKLSQVKFNRKYKIVSAE